MYLGSWKIDDYVDIVASTHSPTTGASTDATSITYTVYENGSDTEIIAATAMTKFDSETGVYLNHVQLTAAAGFEKGKTYAILIKATVSSIATTMWHTLQIEAEVDANVVSATGVDANVTQISGDSTAADNLELDYDGTGYAKANSTIGTLTTYTGNTPQTADSNTLLTAINSRLPAALTVSGNIKASIEEKNAAVGLSDTEKTDANAEVDTALNTAIPGSPTANSINERIKTIDDLAQSGGAGDLSAINSTVATNLDAAVSTRATSAEVTAAHSTTDGKIDVIDGIVDAILVDTGTTLDGKIDTIDTNVDAILVDTGTTLDGKLDTIDANVDAILVDTGTTLDGKIDTIDANVDSILVDTGTTLNDKIDTIDTNVDSILVDTGTTLQGTLTKLENMIVVDGADFQYTANALKLAPTGTGSGLTAQETRDAMLLAPTTSAGAEGSVDDLLDDIKKSSGSGGV